jgi:hypothetical protein
MMAELQLAEIHWTHPRREVVEVLCEHHESQVVGALKTLGIGCTGERAMEGATCMRCAIEAAGQEPRFAYGLVG